MIEYSIHITQKLMIVGCRFAVFEMRNVATTSGSPMWPPRTWIVRNTGVRPRKSGGGGSAVAPPLSSRTRCQCETCTRYAGAAAHLSLGSSPGRPALVLEINSGPSLLRVSSGVGFLRPAASEQESRGTSSSQCCWGERERSGRAGERAGRDRLHRWGDAREVEKSMAMGASASARSG